ncbi:MAG: ABC transporter permease [Chloroflexota bacterium]|nr:ABC transporter permease [Chloroflexota bacterium]
MTVLPVRRGPLSTVRSEAGKVSAFLWRDLLEAWSYRLAFITDALNMALQALLFFYISRIVDPTTLPSYGGGQISYFEFVLVGIAISMVVGVGMFRAAAAFRNEQLMGTLEVLLMTPTTAATIQLGSVVYDLLYVPLRTGLFFLAVTLAADLDVNTGGILPALVTLLCFIPFVWGLGILYAASTVTFKVAGGGFVVSILTLTSGAYFPLSVLPGWLAKLSELNPMTLAVNSMRETLLGDGGWAEIGSALLVLGPASLVTLAFGIVAFRAALLRERRRGTLGLY